MEMAFTLLVRGRVRLMICMHTAVDPPAAEWEPRMRELAMLLAATPDAKHIRMLVVTGGGGPDARQRAQLRDVWGPRQIKVAVIVPGSGNPLKRGLMTALSWINPAMAFFTPDEFRLALEHVEQPEELDAVWSEILKLQSQLAPVRTVRLIAQANELALPDR
jgi:hypothetical protein